MRVFLYLINSLNFSS